MITTDFVAKTKGLSPLTNEQRRTYAPIQRPLYGYVACNWMADICLKPILLLSKAKAYFSAFPHLYPFKIFSSRFPLNHILSYFHKILLHSVGIFLVDDVEQIV